MFHFDFVTLKADGYWAYCVKCVRNTLILIFCISQAKFVQSVYENWPKCFVEISVSIPAMQTSVKIFDICRVTYPISHIQFVIDWQVKYGVACKASNRHFTTSI